MYAPKPLDSNQVRIDSRFGNGVLDVESEDSEFLRVCRVSIDREGGVCVFISGKNTARPLGKRAVESTKPK